MQRVRPEPSSVRGVRFSVAYEYLVHFTSRVFDPENPTFADALCRVEPQRRQRVFAVLDEGLVRAWPSLADSIRTYVSAHSASIELFGPPLVVPGGEAVKNDPEAPLRLQQSMAELGVDRQSFCVIVGGGAVLDMAGFAAATAHRGVRVVRVPTTVLAQNDSGIGVKNGINAFGVKNFVGSFAAPFAVINDAEFLSTLQRRDRIAGIAEAVKVALIRDADFFEWLCENRRALAELQPDATRTMIRRCAELHLDHISGSGDPFEFGSARPLDFGHWAAHKLESLSGHELRHGEAVAIGLALDSRYSVEQGWLAEADFERIAGLLSGLGFELVHPALFETGPDGELAVLGGLRDFREHLGGDLTVTMLKAPGRSFDVNEMDTETIRICIERSRGYASA
ncbi:MAG TPA: 3-dehydroquinate synthase [Polyangiaceae bacterium]